MYLKFRKNKLKRLKQHLSFYDLIVNGIELIMVKQEKMRQIIWNNKSYEK